MSRWGPADAEAYLGSLEQLGVRFGLERMQALCAALGLPQDRFASVHVVGTNGKSSTTEMAVRLLHASGLRAGGCISPHTEGWSERVLFGEGRIDPDAFAEAVEVVSLVAASVERDLPEGDRLTQFEVAIAASFVALADSRVEVAVIEAGLGGRLDATNVIPSRVTALTSVGLDHTQILGATIGEIAAEKLAVLRPDSKLVVGRLDSETSSLAAATAVDRRCELIVAKPPPAESIPDYFSPYLERNAGVALAVHEALGVAGLEPAAARAALEGLPLRGRAEVLAGDPPLILDAAHNAEGAAALAEALPEMIMGRPLIGCLSVLVEKDHDAIARAIGPHLAVAVCTAADPPPGAGRPGARALEPELLAAAFSRVGLKTAEVIAAPEHAVRRALELASECGGVALLAGSHYLLPYSWIQTRAQNSSR